MNNPWPERLQYPVHASTGELPPHVFPESNDAYIIRLLQGLYERLERIESSTPHSPLADVVDPFMPEKPT